MYVGRASGERCVATAGWRVSVYVRGNLTPVVHRSLDLPGSGREVSRVAGESHGVGQDAGVALLQPGVAGTRARSFESASAS